MRSAETSKRSTPSIGQTIAATLIIAALVVGGICAWRRPAHPKQQLTAALVIDASPTAAQNRRCSDVLRIGAEILRGTKGAVRLTVFATGDAKSGGEPVRLGVVTKERQPALLEQSGNTADQRFLGDLDRLCKSAPPSDDSPIFQAVASVVRAFSPNECKELGHTCRLWVRTDGLEESDPQVMASLRHRPRRYGERRQNDHSRLPPRIDNQAVQVVFCGLSERTVARSRRSRLPSVADVERAFRSEFTRPDRVELQTICAPYEALSAAPPETAPREEK